jgi:hypothetical protein
MTQSQLVNLQADGFCNGHKSLSDANKAIAAARNSTPENVRHLFRSVIKWAGGNSYTWHWILK